MSELYNPNYEEERKSILNAVNKKPWENPQPATLENLRRCVSEFTLKTFGPDRDPLTKLDSELAELRAVPDDLEEWADVLIIIMDAYSIAHPGKTADDLLQMAWAKMEKNKARKWAPVPDKPGTWQHIK